MKGNQRLPSLSFCSFTLRFLGVLGVIFSIDASMGMASLIFGPITIIFRVHLSPIFLGRMFVKLKFLRGWHFFCGWQLMGKSLPWVILRLGGALQRIGVVCAIVMRNLWIISSSIVLQLTPCGCICFSFSRSNGSCQALWKAWCFVGAIGWENLIQTFEGWFLAV